MIVKVMFIY